jgi:FixJ family two-component response regulator
MTRLLIGIIDDDEALCLSMADLMSSTGYRSEPFFSAEAFLMSPNFLRFDCVIADIYLSGMSGLNLVQQIRKQRSTTPVILITASHNKHLNDEAVSLGACCLLKKPFETKALLDSVRNLTDGRSHR